MADIKCYVCEELFDENWFAPEDDKYSRGNGRICVECHCKLDRDDPYANVYPKDGFQEVMEGFMLFIIGCFFLMALVMIFGWLGVIK